MPPDFSGALVVDPAPKASARQRPCARCGTPYIGRGRKYCSPQCAEIVRRAGRTRVPVTCLECGRMRLVLLSEARRGARYCGNRCAALHQGRLGFRDRFMARVRLEGPVMRPDLSACHVFLGHVDGDGYGKYSGKRASHVAYFLAHGTWPRKQINHHCDNPACVNPEHLYDGSQRENRHDSRERGRLLLGDRNPSRRMPERLARGEDHGNAAFTNEQVRAIRRAYAAGESPLTIAPRYGVCRRTILNCATGRTYIDVPSDPSSPA